jgi:tetratricopeptide (TPR) repeat protein
MALCQNSETDRENPMNAAASQDSVARIELLVAESRALRFDDPQRMVYLAELARAAAERLDPARDGGIRVADLQARAWAELANAYRLSEAIDRAEDAIARAMSCFESGSGDPELLALIADRLATLLSYRRRFPEAIEILDVLIAFYRERNESHRAGRSLLLRGLYTEYAGEPDAAVVVICEALDLLDFEREPSLLIPAVHNLLWCATTLGQFTLVRRLLARASSLYLTDHNRLSILRLRWLEGRVAAGLQELDTAEAAFAEARRGFDEAGLVFPASLVALDLAELWLRRGRTAEIQAVAEELIGAFQALRVGRETIVSLLLLRRICEQREADLKIREAIERTVLLVRQLAETRR